jgi:hypothetical protein
MEEDSTVLSMYCVERAGRVAGDDQSDRSNRGAPRRDQSGINLETLYSYL